MTTGAEEEVLPAGTFQEPEDISPDGRFIAFASNASGRYEVYVSPFPATGEKVRVSVGGAYLPRWSRDGRELFYLSCDGSLVAVPIGTSPTLHVGAPAALFTLKGRPWLSFDVSRDGKRFLAVVPEITANEQPLSVVVNWPAEVGR